MTYVVTEPCINCKHTTCVEICPVEAFREGKNFLVIDPDECIDCNLCVAECPEEAIFPDIDVPKSQVEFMGINARLSKKWPVIRERKIPLSDGESPCAPAKRELLIED